MPCFFFLVGALGVFGAEDAQGKGGDAEHAHGHDPEARHAREHHAHERVHHPEAARREDLQQRARDRDERLVGRCMAGASSMFDSNTASVRLSVFVTGVRGGAEQQKEARPAHPKWPRQLT